MGYSRADKLIVGLFLFDLGNPKFQEKYDLFLENDSKKGLNLSNKKLKS